MLLIGVTPSGRTELNQQVHHDYLEAVMRAGALPLVFPMTSDEKILTAALNLVDGLLVTGGVDIHPKYFGEEILPCCGTICKERDEMEAFVLRYALDKDMPILCICRGMQFFYSGNDAASAVFAECMRGAVVQHLQPDNSRVCKQAGGDIYLLDRAVGTAVLAECGFLSNPEEAAQLMTPEYREQIAAVLCVGILNYIKESTQP